MRIFFFCLFVGSLSLMWPKTAYSIDHGPIIYGYEMAPVSPGRLHISPNIQFFQTKANYDASGGSFEDLPNGGSYQNISGNLNAAYDMNSHWRVVSGLRFAHATSDDGTFERTTTEVNEFTLGVMVTPYYKVQSRLYLDLISTFALNNFDDTTDDAITGEGAHNVLVGGKYSHSLSLVELFVSLHAQWFSDGRSARLPWRVGTFVHFGSFKMIGSLFGFQTIIDDDSTDTPTYRTNVTNRANGGSFRYYSVNPSVIDSQLGIGWQPYHDLQIEAGLTKTINGESFSEGLGIYLATSLYWGGDDGDTRESRKQRRKILRKNPRPEERFETKQESYDENLFEERKKKKRKKRRKKPISIDEAIQDTVDEFE